MGGQLCQVDNVNLAADVICCARRLSRSSITCAVQTTGTSWAGTHLHFYTVNECLGGDTTVSQECVGLVVVQAQHSVESARAIDDAALHPNGLLVACNVMSKLPQLKASKSSAPQAKVKN